MLLRSSSTPILGSLLRSTASSPAFPEGPSSNHHHHLQSPQRTRYFGDFPKHVSFFSPGHHLASLHSFCTPGFRRVCSDGNLEGLPGSVEPSGEGLRHGTPHTGMMLETMLSVTVYGPEVKDPGEGEQAAGVEEEEEGRLERSATVGDAVDRELSFPEDAPNIVGGDQEGVGALPLFLALGLGINANDPTSAFVNIVGAGGGGGGGGRGGGSGFAVQTDGGGDQSDDSNLEMFYEKMVEENPCDALFLRNYAQFLYEVKRDPWKAEEYYSRAILAEPGDGEILSLYARLVWELYHDYERASWYHNRAVEACPQDCYVVAAYASFLWETENNSGLECYDEAPVAVEASA